MVKQYLKLALGRLLSILLFAGGYLLFGAKLVLDLIGYSTVPEDVNVAQTRLDQIFELILSVPWWAIWVPVLATTLLLIWVSWPRRHVSAAMPKYCDPIKPVAPVEAKKPAPSAAIPQERTRPKTSAYDLPIKLSVIDQLLAIVGSKKELEQTVRTGHSVFRDWDKKIKAGRIRNLFDDLEEYRDKFSALQDKIESIRKDNEKYEDIHEIVDFGNNKNVITALNRLMAVLHHLGPTPPTKFAFFVEPSTKDLSSVLVEFESWRFEAEKALLARRKELSG